MTQGFMGALDEGRTNFFLFFFFFFVFFFVEVLMALARAGKIEADADEGRADGRRFQNG